MRRPLLLVAAGLAATALTATGLPASASNASPTGQAHKHKRVCTSAPKAGTAACDAELQVQDNGVTPAATANYSSGLRPADLAAAYGFRTNSPTPHTIAIVDAYANPNAQSDLNAYRSNFGLAPVTITQLRQDGSAIAGTNAPAADVGWGQEEDLDLDMASAACPNCSIVYVGANSASFSDLVAAENTAHGIADVVSNSYGGSEFRTETSTTYSNAYNVKNDITTISSGDNGYGVEFPAALNGQWVVAVGGTSLKTDPNTHARATETAWSGAGSGCSAYITKQKTWQTDTGCSRRTVADVSAVADPNTGVAVYDSYGSGTSGNWMVFGGTSVAAPLIAGLYANYGIPTSGVATTYANKAGLFDVTSGSNGSCRSSTAYLCKAVAGYDGPTGLGSPNLAATSGSSAF